MSKINTALDVRSDKISSEVLVLVVDDQNAVSSCIYDVLSDEGYRTITASNGEEAIEKVKELSPAVVYLDIWMTGLDGLETLKIIKDISPDTQVVMMSGHATISNALEASRLGAFDFIEKPIDLESIVFTTARAVQDSLDKKKRSQQQNNLDAAIATDTAENRAKYQHPVFQKEVMNLFAGQNVGQRTIKSSIILYGQGLHGGQKSGLVLEPLPKNSGIHFGKIGDSKSVPAFLDYISSTGFATTIRGESVTAATIEHLMSALHAYKITNLLIKCNGEIPILDGSSIEFCNAIEAVGIEEQGGELYEIALDKRIEFKTPNAKDPREMIVLEPSDTLEITYNLHYPDPVGSQSYSFKYKDSQSYKELIAPARTFGFMKDIERLQKVGLALGGRLDNFILIGQNDVVNTELRFSDELVRHKILDIIGDLYLMNRPLRCKITATMTGHSDNISILKLIYSELVSNK